MKAEEVEELEKSQAELQSISAQRDKDQQSLESSLENVQDELNQTLLKLKDQEEKFEEMSEANRAQIEEMNAEIVAFNSL